MSFFTCASEVPYSHFLLWDSHFNCPASPRAHKIIMENSEMDALILKLHSFYIAQGSPGTQRKIGIDHCNPGATESGHALPLQTG